jgi:prepilin-type processing-associated H-X9-DG protein
MNPPPVLPPNTKVRFNISRQDLLLCRLHVLTQNKFILGMILVVSLFIPLTKMNQHQDAQPRINPVLFFVIYFLLMLAFMILLQVVVQVAFLFSSKNQGVLGEHEMELRDDAIVERSTVSELVHRWPGFRKMRCGGGFIFLYVDGNVVYYVPLRAFPTTQAADQFKAEVKRRSQAG